VGTCRVPSELEASDMKLRDKPRSSLSLSLSLSLTTYSEHCGLAEGSFHIIPRPQCIPSCRSVHRRTLVFTKIHLHYPLSFHVTLFTHSLHTTLKLRSALFRTQSRTETIPGSISKDATNAENENNKRSYNDTQS
jgi:hypothetical protein